MQLQPGQFMVCMMVLCVFVLFVFTCWEESNDEPRSPWTEYTFTPTTEAK